MATDRFCHNCGRHVQCREERQEVPGTVRTRLKLSCPTCGKDLGAIYDAELRIERTYPVAR